LHRLSKTVVPATKNYSLTGCEFILPFWFNTIYDYWYALPYDLRKDRKLFLSSVQLMYNNLFPELNKIKYASQAKKNKSFTKKLKELIRNIIHEVYSIPQLRYFLRRLLRKRIVKSNQKMDYLGVYNFCASDTFETDLEVEHYHNRVAEIAFNYYSDKHNSSF